MPDPKPSDYPVNEQEPLKATTLFYIRNDPSSSQDISVLDITDPNAGTQPDEIALVDAKARAADATPTLRFHQDSWYKRRLAATDESEAVVVEFSGPILSLGQWNFTFPAGSPHSSHAIRMRPVGIGSRADWLVVNSVPYFWDMEIDSGTLCRLYKVVDQKRIEVARCRSTFRKARPRDHEGVLLVDKNQVDEVIVVASCIAMLKRIDSFRK